MEKENKLDELKLNFEDLGFKANENPSEEEIKKAVKEYIKYTYGRFFKKGSFSKLEIRVKNVSLFTDPYVIVNNIEFGRPLHRKEIKDIKNEK